MITGASAGLGVEYARQLAGRGYNLLLVARREDRLRELAKEIAATYGVQATCWLPTSRPTKGWGSSKRG